MEVRQVLGGRYKLLNELGSGGMAVVWRARDEVLGRPVAVKVLAARYAGDPQSRARIRDEARAAANLSHPNIAQVYDFGEATESGTPLPYVVMELVNGLTLQQRVASGPVPPRKVFRICGEVAAALAAAHVEGLVHRDIKMANIMVTSAGAKVVDFGIAAAVGQAPEDMLVGTPAYLAPERLTSDEVVPASDVYALGVLLYRLLSGASPWSVESTTQMLRAHVYVEPAPLPPLPAIPPAVVALITRCLKKDPADRPTAGEVSTILADAAEASLVSDVRRADALAADPTVPAGARVPRPATGADDLAADTSVFRPGPPVGRLAVSGEPDEAGHHDERAAAAAAGAAGAAARAGTAPASAAPTGGAAWSDAAVGGGARIEAARAGTAPATAAQAGGGAQSEVSSGGGAWSDASPGSAARSEGAPAATWEAAASGTAGSPIGVIGDDAASAESGDQVGAVDGARAANDGWDHRAGHANNRTPLRRASPADNNREPIRTVDADEPGGINGQRKAATATMSTDVADPAGQAEGTVRQRRKVGANNVGRNSGSRADHSERAAAEATALVTGPELPGDAPTGRRPETGDGAPGVREKKRTILVAAGGVVCAMIAAVAVWQAARHGKADEPSPLAQQPSASVPAVGAVSGAVPSAGGKTMATRANGAVLPGRLAGSSQRPASSAAVPGAGPAVVVPPSGSPSAVPQPTGSADVPPTEPSTPDVPEGTRLTSPGGAVYATCANGRSTLTAWEPAEGYGVESVKRGPALTTRVVFAGPSRYRMNVTCVADAPTSVWLPL